MGKIFSFVVVSLDGFHEGPKGELDWHNVDAEFTEFAIGQLDEVDTLVFGRRTYEMMAAHWPTAAARESDPEVAARMNGHRKIVVTRGADPLGWENSEAVPDPERVLEAGGGKGAAIFGSSTLTVDLLRLGLVDEVRLMMVPVVLGDGRSLFAGSRVELELSATRSFRSGNVLLTYRPVGCVTLA